MSTALSWHHRLAVFTLLATGFLVFAGGMVTSTGSGLAVPDWPLSYGKLFPPMVGGIFYEHGHRMVAGFVALLTALLALVTWRVEPRRWVRRLAGLALLAVIVQAILGGLTVLFLLPIAVSVSHAGLANLFFCSVFALAVVTGRNWRAHEADRAAVAGSTGLRLPWTLAAVVVYCQILVGALMRHSGAGLAIPDFPLAFGRVVPPFRTWPVMIHFGHRIGAVVVVLLLAWALTATWRRAAGNQRLTRPAMLALAIVPVQVLLGAVTVWTEKNPLLTSFHVVVGTALLGVSVWMTLNCWQLAAMRTPGGVSLARRTGAQESAA